jgi:hypothetical protein
MQRFVKGVPILLACVLGYTIFHLANQEPPHISAQTILRLQAKHPNGEVGSVYTAVSLQYEAYGKAAHHQFRVQAFKPGTVEFYDAQGKSVMKIFVEQGDVLITVPKHETIEAYDFEPFQWIE